MSRNSLAVADYHVHPDFSFDARGSIDDYCRAALNQGLSEICFTTHYDRNPILSDAEKAIRINGKEYPNSPDRMQKYIEACREAHDRYYALGLSVRCGVLSVRCGVEIGYYPGCEQELRSLYDNCRFHFRLGAVHEVGKHKICYDQPMRQCAADMSLEDFADQYYKLLMNMVSTRLIDAVAHLDLYRLYGPKYFGEEILDIHQGRLEPLLETMRDLDIGLEINTKAVRKGLAEYYPTMRIVNIARKIGARIMAIGSDAHQPEDVAADFEMASALAYELFPYVDE
jgi:histidinol-phosphatase (PHP family)